MHVITKHQYQFVLLYKRLNDIRNIIVIEMRNNSDESLKKYFFAIRKIKYI